jgi:hypothetical protein
MRVTVVRSGKLVDEAEDSSGTQRMGKPPLEAVIRRRLIKSVCLGVEPTLGITSRY